MTRASLLALALFFCNTVAGAGLMWLNRPRTVATLPDDVLRPAESARLTTRLSEAGVVPGLVLVCRVSPCTDGPAVFVEDGRVQRLSLPESNALTPIVEARR
jgi:hypothetical protein